jgi:UPF0755 protein
VKRLLLICLVLLALAAVIAAGFWQQYENFLRAPLAIGMNIRSVVSSLESQGVTRMNWRWKLLTRLQGSTIKAGEYTLTAGMRPNDLLKLLSSGKVVTYRFTIVEGWSVKQLLTALADNPVLESTLETVAELDGQAGMPAGNPEGWFLPETYVFVRGDSDLHILKRAYADMQVALSDAWSGRDIGLPYETPYELLIMASIVEKETSLASERADIAGVFVRRLNRRWRLETDPTVIYGMGESYRGNIRSRDLKKDTPYNTYTRYGLPPTPIALPGLASLQAAAHPASGDAMFFVADGQGGHTFSTTLEAHNKAVRKLINSTKNKSADAGTLP